MEQRAQEAIAFFENDNEDDKESEAEGNSDSKPIDSVAEGFLTSDTLGMDAKLAGVLEDKMIEENIELPNDRGAGMSQICRDNFPSEIGENAQPPQHNREKEKELVLHSEKTELDLELDRMVGGKRRKPLESDFAFSLAAVPRLHGGENTMIDLETNEVKLREKSEIEKLQERFIAHTMPKAAHLKNQTEVSVFNPDIGGLETLKSSLSADPKPGQAYFSLQQELSKKINDKRRESLMKRIEEEKIRQKEMDIDDAEEMLDEEKMELSDSDAEDGETGEVNEAVNLNRL